jgi:hypothetical protein
VSNILTYLTGEGTYDVFQDSVTPHAVLVSFQIMREVVGVGISAVASGPHMPLILHCNFYLWVSLKDKVYKTDLRTLEQRSNNVLSLGTSNQGE